MVKPIVLLIRDGWGIGPDYPGNAVKAAHTPNMDRLLAEYPNCTLEASGEPVGVRAGSQGSSEVGHLNMGAGRIVAQEVLRVDLMIRNGELFKVPRLLEAVRRCKEEGKKFHLMGLVQDQGVHATQDHLFAILQFLAKEGVKDVCVHFFADGRDTPPQSALTYLAVLEKCLADCGTGRVASVMGRYWAMDRAENWTRTEKAYRALMYGEGYKAPSAKAAIEEAYLRAEQEKAHGEEPVETDEFILPTLITDANGHPNGLIEPGDAVLHFNYRQDRALQMTRVFWEDNFTGFNRGAKPDVFYMGLTRYYDEFTGELVPPMNMANLLGEVLSRKGLRQLRIAEFQKYRHVTSFFNGKLLEPCIAQDSIMVESITIPEDQKPEMSAYEVTDLVLTAVNDGIAAVRKQALAGEKSKLDTRDEGIVDPARLKDTYDVIVLNYANGDMVGHTGVFNAVVKAIEAVDDCVGKVVDAVLKKQGTLLITADHGNAEQMTDPETGAIQTAHSTNLVECVLVGPDAHKYPLIEQGKLSDLAITILDLLGIAIPKEMTAESLLKK